MSGNSGVTRTNVRARCNWKSVTVCSDTKKVRDKALAFFGRNYFIVWSFNTVYHAPCAMFNLLAFINDGIIIKSCESYIFLIDVHI